MLELTNITPDEFERWMRTQPRVHVARFNHDPEALRSHFDLARSIAVFKDGPIVGGGHLPLIEMSAFGDVATVAGLPKVEVEPTHTRRGIMMQVTRRQIDGIHKRIEPLAELLATESAIYGRIGYGVGSGHEQWSIDKSHNAYAYRSQRNLPS